MSRPLEHAVCVTGQERSFLEIGANIREGVLTMLAGSVTFFGVRPRNETWAQINRLLPMARVETQRGPCWSARAANTTFGWMHCDFRYRTGDCRLNFLQSLCDLRQCEELISDHEAKGRGGRAFDAVTRLRPDLFWEAALEMPTPLPNTVFVPAMDSPSGVNDHLAFGERGAMRKYLRRVDHVEHALRLPPTKTRAIHGSGSEGFLELVLNEEKVEVRRLPEWTYCPHTRRDLKRKSGEAGCIGRVRCRVRCASLWCPSDGIKGGECECFDRPCAAFAAGDVQTVLGPRHDEVVHYRQLPRTPCKSGCSVKQRGRMPLKYIVPGNARTRCVDVAGRQLFHACPPPGPPPAPGADSGPGHAAATRRSHGLDSGLGLPHVLPHKCASACAWDAGTGDTALRQTVGAIRTERLPPCFSSGGFGWGFEGGGAAAMRGLASASAALRAKGESLARPAAEMVPTGKWGRGAAASAELKFNASRKQLRDPRTCYVTPSTVFRGTGGVWPYTLRNAR